MGMASYCCIASKGLFSRFDILRWWDPSSFLPLFQNTTFPFAKSKNFVLLRDSMSFLLQ